MLKCNNKSYNVVVSYKSFSTKILAIHLYLKDRNGNRLFQNKINIRPFFLGWKNIYKNAFLAIEFYSI
jgi:hypothetical protein